MTDGTFRAPALGPAQTLQLSSGELRAHVVGEGPAIVFVHGALVNANLWRHVVARLDGFTCVTLDLPLGSHLVPMPRADMTFTGLAGIIGEAVEALGLSDVTLVGNDSGGGISQVTAAARPEWLGRLVLTSCDAYENTPPPFFVWVLKPLKFPRMVPTLFAGLRIRRLRRLPIAYGWLTNQAPEPPVDDSYVLPVLTDPGVRDDLARLIRYAHPQYTEAAARELASFDRPALIAWSRGDRFFPDEHAERLAATIPDARLEWLEGARSLSPEDRPDRIAELLAEFAAVPLS